MSPDERLLLDAMLGKLATYLRMAGYDAAYVLDDGVERDDAVLSWAEREGRTLLTRDEALARRAVEAVLLTERDIEDQLAELRAAGYDLSLDEPVRCGTCNGELVRVPGGGTTPGSAPDPANEGVWRCRDCGQHFWRGSHWDDVRRTLDG